MVQTEADEAGAEGHPGGEGRARTGGRSHASRMGRVLGKGGLLLTTQAPTATQLVALLAVSSQQSTASRLHLHSRLQAVQKPERELSGANA